MFSWIGVNRGCPFSQIETHSATPFLQISQRMEFWDSILVGPSIGTSTFPILFKRQIEQNRQYVLFYGGGMHAACSLAGG
jgi:hypothetical protein